MNHTASQVSQHTHLKVTPMTAIELFAGIFNPLIS
jgi:hypothetical protein